MIGTKIYKKNIDWIKYKEIATWCNAQKTPTVIKDMGEYYEVVEVKGEEYKAPIAPTLSERIVVLEDAVNTLMEGEATNG
jgi:hypothetical protein